MACAQPRLFLPQHTRALPPLPPAPLISPAQTQRDARLLLQRAAQLGQEAERQACNAERLMRRAAEKAAECLDAKQAAQVRRPARAMPACLPATAGQQSAPLPTSLHLLACTVQEEEEEGAGSIFGQGPITPDVPRQGAAQRSMAQRLSTELEAAQKGQAAAQLHASQLAELGRM